MYHGPFLVVSDRIDSHLRVVRAAAHRLAVRPGLHADDPGALPGGDRSGRLPRSRCRAIGASSSRRSATGPADVEEAGAAYVRAASAALTAWLAAVPGRRAGRAWRSRAASTARRRGCWRARPRPELGRDPDDVRAFTLDFGGGADAAQADDVARSAGARGHVGARRGARGAVRPARGDPAPSRTTTRSTWSARPRRCACCAASASAIRRCAISRRRRRRREPEGLSARGLGPDAVERLAQPAALPGRLGHRRHQAQPGVLGRAVARLRAHVRARGALRLHGVLAVHRAGRSIAAAPAHAVRAGARRRPGAADDAEAGRRARRRARR